MIDEEEEAQEEVYGPAVRLPSTSQSINPKPIQNPLDLQSNDMAPIQNSEPTNNIQLEEQAQEKAPSYSDIQDASTVLGLPYTAIRRSDEAINDFFADVAEEDAGYRAIDDPLMNFSPPEYRGQLSSSKNHAQLLRGIQDIDDQLHAREVRAKSGIWSNFGADLITNAFTFAVPALAIESKITAGAGLIAGARAAGLSAGAEAVVEQGTMYGLLETQDLEETAINVAAQTFTAGLIGGTVGYLISKPAKDVYRSVHASMKGYSQQFRVNDKGIVEAVEAIDDSTGVQKYIGDVAQEPDVPAGGSAPDAPFQGRTVEGEGLYQDFSYKGVGPASPFIWTGANWARNPFLLAKKSPSLTVQAVANDFYKSNFRLTKTAVDGTIQAPALQELINTASEGPTIQASDLINDAYNEYIGITVKPTDSRVILGLIRAPLKKFQNNVKKNDLMSKPEFETELYKGVVANEHPDPFISARAKKINDLSNAPISDSLKAAGYSLPNNPYGAINHLGRRYNNRAILADQHNKVATLEGWFGETNQEIYQIRKHEWDLEVKIQQLEKGKVKDVKEIEKLKADLEEYRAQIERNIEDNIYDASLLITKNGKRQLGEVLTEKQIKDSAYRTFLNITQTAPDILAHQGANATKAGSVGGSLKEHRVLLRSDLDLINAGFLETDLVASISAKIRNANRLIIVEDWFKRNGWDGVQNKKTYLSSLISNDYRRLQENTIAKFQDKIAANPDQAEKIEKQLQRALLKLDSSKKTGTSVVNNAYERISGDYDMKDGDALRRMRIMKKWGYSTQLLANVISGVDEVVTGIYTHGVSNYIKEGPTAYVHDLATFWKKGNARFRAQMRHFNIATETELAINGQKLANNLEYIGTMQRLEAASDQFSRAGQVLGGSSLLGDWCRNINARVSVGMLIRDLKAWEKGKLSSRGLRRFQDGRFDVNMDVDGRKLGDVILEEFRTHGERVGGANLPNVPLWGNTTAQKEVERLVRNEVDRVIFAGNNPSSFPNELDPHGIASSLFMYMGHTFQAISNFTIPFLQNIKDKEKAQGIIAILAIGILKDPIRKIVNGKELSEDDFDPRNMFLRSIQESGLTGAIGEYFNRLNAVFDFVPALQTEKHQLHRGFGELLSGPIGSLVENTGQVSASILNNEWNKSDAKKLQKIVPLLKLWYFREPINNYVEQLDIPETRANARVLNE